MCITGLSEHLLRAWERRYGAIVPRRTPGGSRRYRESDIERLKLLQAAVEAGHPIGGAGARAVARTRAQIKQGALAKLAVRARARGLEASLGETSR